MNSDKPIKAAKRVKKPIKKAVKRAVWVKYFGLVKQGTCECKRIIYDDDFHASHILAEVNGGEATVENLRPMCRPCNLSCGTDNLNSFIKDVKAAGNKQVTTNILDLDVLSNVVSMAQDISSMASSDDKPEKTMQKITYSEGTYFIDSNGVIYNDDLTPAIKSSIKN